MKTLDVELYTLLLKNKIPLFIEITNKAIKENIDFIINDRFKNSSDSEIERISKEIISEMKDFIDINIQEKVIGSRRSSYGDIMYMESGNGILMSLCRISNKTFEGFNKVKLFNYNGKEIEVYEKENYIINQKQLFAKIEDRDKAIEIKKKIHELQKELKAIEEKAQLPYVNLK